MAYLEITYLSSYTKAEVYSFQNWQNRIKKLNEEREQSENEES